MFRCQHIWHTHTGKMGGVRIVNCHECAMLLNICLILIYQKMEPERKKVWAIELGNSLFEDEKIFHCTWNISHNEDVKCLYTLDLKKVTLVLMIILHLTNTTIVTVYFVNMVRSTNESQDLTISLEEASFLCTAIVVREWISPKRRSHQITSCSSGWTVKYDINKWHNFNVDFIFTFYWSKT